MPSRRIGYQIGTGVPVALIPTRAKPVVEDGREEQAQEAPHRGGVEEPATPVPGLRGRIGVAVVAIAALAQRLDREGAPQRTRRPAQGRSPTDDRAKGHAIAATDRTGHRRDADQAGREDDHHDRDPEVVDQLLRDEAEDVQRRRLLRPMAHVHEQGEEGRQGHRDQRADDRSGGHRPGQAGSVVVGDRISASGSHELARLGLCRARFRSIRRRRSTSRAPCSRGVGRACRPGRSGSSAAGTSRRR